MIAPTEKQLAILRFWSTYTDEHGYPPSFREAANALGFRSTETVRLHVEPLRRKGCMLCGLNSSDRTLSRGTTITAVGRAAIGSFLPPQKPRKQNAITIPERKCVCLRSFFSMTETRCHVCRQQRAAVGGVR